MTAVLWAVVHLQYDPYVIAQVFAYGLVLGWLRWVTGSTVLTMLLHGLINFEGMLETFVALHALMSIPRRSQDLADLLATGDGGFGSRRQFDMYQI